MHGCGPTCRTALVNPVQNDAQNDVHDGRSDAQIGTSGAARTPFRVSGPVVGQVEAPRERRETQLLGLPPSLSLPPRPASGRICTSEGTEARALRVPASMPPGCRPLGGALPLPDRSATLADSFSPLPVSNDSEPPDEVLGTPLTIGQPGRVTRRTGVARQTLPSKPTRRSIRSRCGS